MSTVLPCSTNATINYITGGGGHSVTAINNTGDVLAFGDKVWLNRHNLDEVTTSQQVNSRTRDMYKLFFFEGNNIYDYNLSSGLLEKYVYNAEDKDWTQNSLWTQKLTYTNYARLKQIGDKIIVYGIKDNNWLTSQIGNIIVNSDVPVPFTGVYLGNDLLYRPYDGTLCAVNTNTGEVGDIYYTFSLPKTGNAFKDGNTLLITTPTGYYFYDITDLNNPVLLKSATNVTYIIEHVTGLTPGSYLFALTGGTKGGFNGVGKLIIYQINENYELIRASNLPATLQNIVETTAAVTFMNNILCVGTVDNVYAYQWVNNTFTDLNVSLDLTSYVEDKYDGYPHVFNLSKDLTTATLGYRSQGTGYVYMSHFLFKLATTSDAWFADSFNQITPYSLSGYVSGVNEGKVTVDTVLPEQVTLTLNFTPEADVAVEFTGGVNA